MYEDDLSKELQNGRLLRLMVPINSSMIGISSPYAQSKLEFATDRSQRDKRWGQQADSYLLTLLRGYIFHQVRYYWLNINLVLA